MEKIMQVDVLTKNFNGLIAVNNISFSVNKGEIFGRMVQAKQQPSDFSPAF